MAPSKRNCWGFDVMPYGHLSWIIPSVTFFAMLFFLFPAFRCSLTVEKQPGDIEIWYGYWQKENAAFAVALGAENDSNVCIKWGKDGSREIFDGAWKFGKAVGVIGSFTTIIAAVGNVYLFVGRLSLDFFSLWIGVHTFNSFLNFMLLIGLKSIVCESRDCKLARGGYVAIFGGLFWFVATILLFLVRRVEDELERDSSDERWEDDFDEERLRLPQQEDESDEEVEHEAPLALPAPPTKASNKPKSSSREVPLALPPSETSTSPQPSAKKTKKKSGARSKSDLKAVTTSEESPEVSGSGAMVNDESSASLVSSSMEASKASEKKSKSSDSGTKKKKKKKKKVTEGSTTKSVNIPET